MLQRACRRRVARHSTTCISQSRTSNRRRVDNDPPLVSTLDAAALSERNRDAGPGGLLGLREPAGFRDLAVFVQGRSSMGSGLVSIRPGWVLTCGNGLASGKLKPAFADGRKTATG